MKQTTDTNLRPPDLDDLERKVKDLAKIVRQLEARVEELERDAY